MEIIISSYHCCYGIVKKSLRVRNNVFEKSKA
uniref:Uncharacterized protein n=1 Tax=Anguilla anguilla TaxID=7936 RepID=A0A0E9PDH8_ANGAN